MSRLNSLNELINKVIFKNGNMCCLCLSTINYEPIRLNDKIGLTESKLENVEVGVIISFLLGDEIFTDISTSNEFCLDCITLATKAYQFVKQSKDNIQFLVNTVDHLNMCFERVADDLSDCKTLFITLNSNLEVTNQYYDNVVFAQNIPSAFQRFKSIVNYQSPKHGQKLNKAESVLKKDYTKIDIKAIMTERRPAGQFQCRLCFKLFSNASSLKEHYLRFHCPKQYKCNLCSKMFAFEKHLAQHKDYHHANLVCSECGKKFQNKYCLKAHEESHQIKYVCPDCGRVYKNRNTLKKHKDNDICQHPYRHSPADAKFTCDYCQKKYTQKISLRVHIQYEHLGYKYLKCKWCDKKFSCQSRLNAHAVKHTKEKNFACSFCSGKFVSKESLLYHTRIHTGERPYQCPHCDSRFLSASRRQAHVKSYHTDPTVECDICYNKFRSVQYLQKHKKIHFPENVNTHSSKFQEEVVKEYDNSISKIKNEFNNPTFNKINEIRGVVSSLPVQKDYQTEISKFEIKEENTPIVNEVPPYEKDESDAHVHEHLVFY